MLFNIKLYCTEIWFILKYEFDNLTPITSPLQTMICDWTKREEDFGRLYTLLTEQLAKKGSLPSVQPWHALAYPLSLSELLQLSKRYASRVKLNVALCDSNFKFRPKNKSARLKIGYVSSDFGWVSFHLILIREFYPFMLMFNEIFFQW